jgi:hypothetical protein
MFMLEREICSMEEGDQFVRQDTFAMYCRSVNGDLSDLKLSLSNVDAKLEARHRETMEHFDTIVSQETERRRNDVQLAFKNTEKALETATTGTEKAVAKALEGTMSKSYAIIITILTAACTGLLGALIALIATKGRL